MLASLRRTAAEAAAVSKPEYEVCSGGYSKGDKSYCVNHQIIYSTQNFSYNPSLHKKTVSNYKPSRIKLND